jgi:hypothetical protein
MTGRRELWMKISREDEEERKNVELDVLEKVWKRI